jgi:hypothetical protein
LCARERLSGLDCVGQYLRRIALNRCLADE